MPGDSRPGGTCNGDVCHSARAPAVVQAGEECTARRHSPDEVRSACTELQRSHPRCGVDGRRAMRVGVPEDSGADRRIGMIPTHHPPRTGGPRRPEAVLPGQLPDTRQSFLGRQSQPAVTAGEGMLTACADAGCRAYPQPCLRNLRIANAARWNPCPAAPSHRRHNARRPVFQAPPARQRHAAMSITTDPAGRPVPGSATGSA